ncbi:MAG: hypothetical protein MK085_13395, partial [Phycisphaerales bacterium]|nr:hypothetical protein [Phycisphaerales bacterium]
VADFRPRRLPNAPSKHRRGDLPTSIELDPVPDLLADLHDLDRHGQLRIGFALEPREGLEASARRKLEAKKLHAIVANPLETMDAEDVEGFMVLEDGTTLQPPAKPMPKTEFAPWLLNEALRLWSH